MGIFSATYASLLTNALSSITVTELLTLGFGILLVFSSYLNRASVNAPFVGYRSWFEPTFLLRLRFLTNAKGILTSGYENVSETRL